MNAGAPSSARFATSEAMSASRSSSEFVATKTARFSSTSRRKSASKIPLPRRFRTERRRPTGARSDARTVCLMGRRTRQRSRDRSSQAARIQCPTSMSNTVPVSISTSFSRSSSSTSSPDAHRMLASLPALRIKPMTTRSGRAELARLCAREQVLHREIVARPALLHHLLSATNELACFGRLVEPRLECS